MNGACAVMARAPFLFLWAEIACVEFGTGRPAAVLVSTLCAELPS